MPEVNGPSISFIEAKVGSASDFRDAINDNFSKIADQWSNIGSITVFAGPSGSESAADKALGVNGIWLVTDGN